MAGLRRAIQRHARTVLPCLMAFAVLSACDGAPQVVDTPEPTGTVTLEATTTPTPVLTGTPTPEPTNTLTPEPTATPTPSPTDTSTPEPTYTPTLEPTVTPTPSPTDTASPEPTATPTLEPTDTPTPEPTYYTYAGAHAYIYAGSAARRPGLRQGVSFNRIYRNAGHQRQRGPDRGRVRRDERTRRLAIRHGARRISWRYRVP